MRTLSGYSRLIGGDGGKTSKGKRKLQCKNNKENLLAQENRYAEVQ